MQHFRIPAPAQETGAPVVLTINGKAEIIVQDAKSYQKLLERAERPAQREITRRSVGEMKAGKGRPAEAMLAEMNDLVVKKKTRK